MTFEPSYFIPLMIIGFLLSAALNFLIIRAFLSERLNALIAEDTMAHQALHKTPTPRLGGLAIIVAATLVLWLHPSELKVDLVWALAAGGIIFLVGLKEDIFRNVSPAKRLLAAFASAGVAIFYSTAMITRFDLPFGNEFILWSGFWIAFTLIWSAGTCHALNLIDGLNGLASGYVMIALAGIFSIASQTGDFDVMMISLVLISTVLGFFVFNWPSGAIFLGDAGAYTLGHIIAWLGIILVHRHSEFSIFSFLLILFWPVCDTIFTIVRRLFLRRQISQPDRLHFHHITIRTVFRLLSPNVTHATANSLSTLIMCPIMASPVILGVISWNNKTYSFFVFIIFVVLYFLAYLTTLDFLKQLRFSSRKLRSHSETKNKKDILNISKYSGMFIRDSLCVNVSIKKHDIEKKWDLEIFVDEKIVKSWHRKFNSELSAWNFFMEIVERDGMDSFLISQPNEHELYDDQEF